VRHRGSAIATWGRRLFIIPHILIGLGVLLAAVWETILYLGVLLIGTEVEGRILQTSKVQTKNGFSCGVEYAYSVGGRQFIHKKSVTDATHVAVNAGDAVTIRTLLWTSAGHWPRLPDHQPLTEAASMWKVALFWNGVLSIFLWKFYWMPLRQRRLVRWGALARGVVQDVKLKSWIRINPDTAYIEITYVYAVDGDSPQQAQLLTGHVNLTDSVGNDIRTGDELTVIYDPRRPKRSLVYKLAVYCVQPASAI
jgi:hypothetical protein